MKRLLIILLTVFTCFNLAGGNAMAAAIVKLGAKQKKEVSLPINSQQNVVKKSAMDVQTMQINKNETEEDDFLLQNVALSDSLGLYRFSLDFKLLNRYFLVQYGTAIKEKRPAAFLMHQNFRL